jgi:hypothetical protein
MKTCPYCGRENDEAAVACLECGTEFGSGLSESTPQALLDPALSLAVVATFRNTVDAGILKARLEAAGIEACIPEEYSPQIFWSVIPSPLESVTVRVAKKDYEAASEIFAEFETGLPVNHPGGPKLPTQPEVSQKQSVAEAEVQFEDPQNLTLCVACRAPISKTTVLCPKCGWTQPERK